MGRFRPNSPCFAIPSQFLELLELARRTYPFCHLVCASSTDKVPKTGEGEDVYAESGEHGILRFGAALIVA